MLVLTIKTDQPQAEIGLYQDGRQTVCQKWHGHRQLSMTIHKKIEELLARREYKWSDIEGIVFFAGPGSFTGLRIGASVASALAYGLDKPVVSSKGKSWTRQGLARLEKAEDDRTAIPYYGAKPNTSKPKK